MRKSYLIGLLLLIVVIAVFAGWFLSLSPFFAHNTSAGIRILHLDGDVVRATVADTQTLRERGLSGRAGLAYDEGMLFVFNADGMYSFWMKDMLFPIDILWLSSAGRVVHIVQSISPDTFPQAFTSDTPARYVLELPAGYVARHGVRTGDSVQF